MTHYTNLNMDLREYSKNSREYETSLSDIMKKNGGVYYTDIDLCLRIIKFLKIPVNASIFDPCCGTGNFIVSAKHLGCYNLYGSDIDNCAVDFCKDNTGLRNIHVIDSISNNGDFVLHSIGLNEKVDFVIGNPPYVPIGKDATLNTQDSLFLRKVKDSGNNLFVAAMYRGFELVKDDGVISYVIPKNFLHVSSYSRLRKFILKEKRIKSIIDLGACFKNVRGEQIVLTISNEYTPDNTIEFFSYHNGNFIKGTSVSQKFYTDDILIFENQYDIDIYGKFKSSYKTLGGIHTGYVGRGKSKSPNAVIGKDIRKFAFKDIPVPRSGNRIFIQNIYSAESGIIASFGGHLDASETVTVFLDDDENMCRYVLGLLHSRLCNYYLMRFCFNGSKLTIHSDAKYLKKIPLVINDNRITDVVTITKSLEKIPYLSNEWYETVEKLNDVIYDIYNMTEEEIQYIDKQVKSIQSEKWNYNKQNFSIHKWTDEAYWT